MTTLAIRYRCLYEGTARCGADQRKRAKCQYCSGPMFEMHGAWGVFTWRGDGRYQQVEPHRTYTSKSAADRYAAAHDYVTRWIAERL